jgi:hypothetical protein
MPKKVGAFPSTTSTRGILLTHAQGYAGLGLEWSLKFPKPVKTNARVGACFQRVNAVHADRIAGGAPARCRGD